MWTVTGSADSRRDITSPELDGEPCISRFRRSKSIFVFRAIGAPRPRFVSPGSAPATSIASPFTMVADTFQIRGTDARPTARSPRTPQRCATPGSTCANAVPAWSTQLGLRQPAEIRPPRAQQLRSRGPGPALRQPRREREHLRCRLIFGTWAGHLAYGAQPVGTGHGMPVQHRLSMVDLLSTVVRRGHLTVSQPRKMGGRTTRSTGGTTPEERDQRGTPCPIPSATEYGVTQRREPPKRVRTNPRYAARHPSNVRHTRHADRRLTSSIMVFTVAAHCVERRPG
jgi:hypothetical protein